ncbi:protein-glutamate methylesterase CheB [Halobacterium jilantaiense]|uniref:Protein-glutamate methylesterase/protein-glutamine glutaminase n=1 Tax=Halobacterium jilantaiense TaxID=355548 RepID=A0A1I0MXC4_9EURY|nr:protein-glutamate methylesterase CheB [Halobacterium jilantaiense]SEV93556.1 two-component system, chemotaxis family, response regulator CheB [Halobacterium jilantaiense]
MTRALVVDDSHFMRTVISDILEDGGVEVVATAENGVRAVEQVESVEPDVVTMDVEMPEMNGIEAVEEIMDRQPTPVLMVSALTTEDAEASLEAMQKGAIDTFAKPGGTISTELSGHSEELVAAVERVAAADPTAGHDVDMEPAASPETATEYVNNPTLLIGASTGGPNVVESILASLPREADFRVLVVQHMPDQFTTRFADRLDSASEYDISEAEDGSRIGGGEGLVAAGDYHMRVSGYSNGRLRVRLDQSERRHSVRPAIDVTFESAAERVTDPLVGVVLTGMGSDGADGIRAVKEAGGTTLAQDEATSAVFGIPERAIETGCVDEVLPADRLTEGIADSVRRST